MPIVNANPGAPRRRVKPGIQIPVDLTITPPATSYNVIGPNATVPAGCIMPGELVYLTANYKVASLATSGSGNANAANFVGVANDQYPLLYGAGITGSTQPPGDPMVPMIEIYDDGEYLFNTTSGDTYHAYDTVYLGVDGRTISKTATGTLVGQVSPDQRQTSTQLNPPLQLPIAGGTGVQIYVKIKSALAY